MYSRRPSKYVSKGSSEVHLSASLRFGWITFLSMPLDDVHLGHTYQAVSPKAFDVAVSNEEGNDRSDEDKEDQGDSNEEKQSNRVLFEKFVAESDDESKTALKTQHLLSTVPRLYRIT